MKDIPPSTLRACFASFIFESNILNGLLICAFSAKVHTFSVFNSYYLGKPSLFTFEQTTDAMNFAHTEKISDYLLFQIILLRSLVHSSRVPDYSCQSFYDLIHVFALKVII